MSGDQMTRFLLLVPASPGVQHMASLSPLLAPKRHKQRMAYLMKTSLRGEGCGRGIVTAGHGAIFYNRGAAIK